MAEAEGEVTENGEIRYGGYHCCTPDCVAKVTVIGIGYVASMKGRLYCRPCKAAGAIDGKGDGEEECQKE
jgi:hypothetical protein